MAEESDGIDEAFEGQIRVIVTAAGQLGERLARAREESLRRAQAQEEQTARELQSRFAAEQQAARAELANVHRADWWDRATPEQIGRTYEIATAWRGEDAEAQRAEQRMRDELRGRYGIDVDNTNADPAAVRLAMERAERDRAQATTERDRASVDHAEAQLLVAHANEQDRRADEARASARYEPDPDEREAALAEAARHDVQASAARQEHDLAYDSSERRDATARDLEARGIDESTVATRMRADVSQGKPATQAVDGTQSKAPTARKRRATRGAEVQRTGLDR